jgi:hypothetical protein
VVRVTVVGLPFSAVLVKMSNDVTDVCEVIGGLLVADGVVEEPMGGLDSADDGLVVDEEMGEPGEVVEDEDPERELKELEREVEFSNIELIAGVLKEEGSAVRAKA